MATSYLAKRYDSGNSYIVNLPKNSFLSSDEYLVEQEYCIVVTLFNCNLPRKDKYVWMPEV